ncbi:MAG TPA: ferritin-like domain-containing protein [Sphingomonas sp.]
MTDRITDDVFAAIGANGVLAAIDERRAARRGFLRYAGGAAAVAGGAALLSACGGSDNPTPAPTPTPTSANIDIDVLNFALNLEYLEAQFYSWACFGRGLDASLTTGIGAPGTVTGGAAVPFQDTLVAAYAREIAFDEIAHVAFLRSALGSATVAMPAINIDGSATGAFTTAARAAGVVGPTGVFNPYADDNSFLLGAFIFEDVGVSAYKGAAPLITNKTFVEAAAGILATEAYHAGLIRTLLYRKGLDTPAIATNAGLISDARDSLDGTVTNAATGVIGDDDQGVLGTAEVSNIVPTDGNAIAFSRSTGQVLNIAYLSKAAISSGGFFPAGVNGNIRTSAANA